MAVTKKKSTRDILKVDTIITKLAHFCK